MVARVADGVHHGPSPRAWGAPSHLVGAPEPDRTIPTCVGSTNRSGTPDRPATDHPHVRGEHRTAVGIASPVCGPSPRAWGALDDPPTAGLHCRTIPTCVGSTRRRRAPASRPSDHPHVRGEHVLVNVADHRPDGPSPRAWGAPEVTQGLVQLGRTIPTCVGSTCCSSNTRENAPDHPHVRGEHASWVLVDGEDGGPSPRAWGALGAQQLVQRVGRTIPTCVGSTRRAAAGAAGGPDHPHVRGEHLSYLRALNEGDGPSPRAWGAHHPGGRHGGHQRTIPTCVGSTPPPPSETTRWPDHPHVRGEHAALGGEDVEGGGPSPRAWGAQGDQECEARTGRTIPTCVGSTQWFGIDHQGKPDHPHVRGEHARLTEDLPARGGPSPRAWGALLNVPFERSAGRTIPTCVGSTLRIRMTASMASDHPHVRGEHGVPHHADLVEGGPSPRAWGALGAHVGGRQVGRTIPTCVGSTT